jgi:multidrug efflux pump subunit AcrA (membrane-fusion protein)
MAASIDLTPHRRIQKTEFLPPLGWMMHLGGLGLAATVITSVVVAANVRYDKIVKAQAIARPQGELRLIQSASEGSVKQILVQENQTVKQGDAIAILEHSQIDNQQQQLQSELQQNQLQLQQIAQQLQQLDAQTTAEANATDRTVAVAEADLVKQQRDLQDRQLVTQADVREAESLRSFAREEMQRYQQLAETGAIALIQVKAKEEAFNAAQAKLDRAMAQTNPSDAPIAAALETIQQQKAQGAVSKAQQAQAQARLISQQITLQEQGDSKRLKLQQLHRDQAKSVLRAPISGKMHQLSLRNVGQYVPLGQTIAQLSPQSAPLLFKAQISAEEIGQIKSCLSPRSTDSRREPCNKVQMRVAAFPYPEYGVLSGKIIAIAADVGVGSNPGGKPINPTAAESSQSSQPLFYEVTIQPDQSFLTKSNQSFPLEPGMGATVEIATQSENLLSFLLKKARLMTTP